MSISASFILFIYFFKFSSSSLSYPLNQRALWCGEGCGAVFLLAFVDLNCDDLLLNSSQ
jgi:hypothetical protein